MCIRDRGRPGFFPAILSTLIGARPLSASPSFDSLSPALARFFAGEVEPVFPTNDVLVGAQHTQRPDSIDVDLYQFEISGAQAGLFTAEILAERLGTSSLLDSVLRVYKESASGERELIAQNDDYFSEDSFLQLELEPGTYYVGVSSTGNDQYDPTISGTGYGGTSQGEYELRLDFRANILDSLADTTGVAFDGDSDGKPGGVYNFWFRAAAPSGTEGVNEVQSLDVAGSTSGTFTITFAGETTGPIAFNATPSTVETALSALTNIGAGNVSVSGAALPAGPLSVEFIGDLEKTDVAQLNLDTTGLTNGTATVSTITQGRQLPRTVYVDKADTTPDTLANAGTLANPYNVIHSALNLDINGLPKSGAAADPNAAGAGDVVRILANGTSAEDSQAYQIGLNSFNQPLADGARIDIPNDVVVMVDAGAVFEMRRSAIIVGSTAIGIDHSRAALQVLGTPDRQVVFTSINDAATAERGDWGGILFAGDLDQDSLRDRYEEDGIFLNHIGQADISFGGGVVNIGSIPQEIAPIDIRDARPTITNNTLTTNAVAAILSLIHI